MFPSTPLTRSHLQHLKDIYIHRLLVERAQELATQCADFAILKAKVGHVTATWSPPKDQLIIRYSDTLSPLTLTYEQLAVALKSKMPDLDITQYENGGYTYYLLDWS